MVIKPSKLHYKTYPDSFELFFMEQSLGKFRVDSGKDVDKAARKLREAILKGKNVRFLPEMRRIYDELTNN